MILKIFLRTLISYRFSLVKIIFFELFFLLKGNKGNRFTISKNEMMTDSIPCPYYFLYKIKKKIVNNNCKLLLDLGCGSGRVIDFFNKGLLNKHFIGIEYFEKHFLYCKKNFEIDKNIKLVKANFIDYDFLQYNADCYFFNDPIKNDKTSIDVLKKIADSPHTKDGILLIVVNCNNVVLNALKNVQCIKKYYINDKKGFSIYRINKK